MHMESEDFPSDSFLIKTELIFIFSEQIRKCGFKKFGKARDASKRTEAKHPLPQGKIHGHDLDNQQAPKGQESCKEIGIIIYLGVTYTSICTLFKLSPKLIIHSSYCKAILTSRAK